MQPDSQIIEQVVDRIVESIRPLRIILFGSAARGEMGKDSDMDILVVMPEGTHRMKTAQDLHIQLYGVPAAVDVLVATPSDLEKHKDNIGLIYKTILREGKDIYVA